MRKIDGAIRNALLIIIMISSGLRLSAAELDPQRGVADPDGMIIWYDGKLLALTGKGWAETESYFDRLPARAQAIVPKDVWGLSHDSAGMYLRFSSDSSTLRVRWVLSKNDIGMPHMPATGVSGLDLYMKDKQGKWCFVCNGRPRTVTKNKVAFTLVPGAEYMLYLPLYNGVKSLELGIPKNNHLSTPAPSKSAGHKPIVFYGTSITQGGCASRPGMAATSIIGRALDVPVINLGFSGSGRMEPEMATLVAELDPSVFVVDCLANMSVKMVEDRAEPFVRVLRKAHPVTPILLVEDSSVHNDSPTEKGRILRIICDKLTKEGVTGLRFLPSKDMLGNDSEGTVDGCHPNDLGMMRQAEIFIRALNADGLHPH